jgi:uncharacterized protein (TIGR02145 family)
MICLFIASCHKKDNSIPPVVETYSPLYISSFRATIGCNVKSDGGSSIASCGVYMGTAQDPETSGARLQMGNDTGLYLGQVTGLQANTQYFIKAFASNSAGESLGNLVDITTPATIIDYDDNSYETVKIGNHLWMAENLKTLHFTNGENITTTDPATLDISAEDSPVYQWAYDGDPENIPVYGRLYTWFTVTDARNICPAGWHIPSDDEWSALESDLGGYIYAGSMLKESGNTHWISPYNLDATNESCFNALPGGYRNQTGGFSYAGNYGYWWSSTEGDADNGWIRSLFVQSGQSLRIDFNKKHGASVRCIKDVK